LRCSRTRHRNFRSCGRNELDPEILATDDVASAAQRTSRVSQTSLQPQQTRLPTATMLRPTLSFVRLPLKPLANTLTRTFSLLNPTQRSHVNRVFDPVRQPNDLHTLTLLNAADNRSLITFWSASWCQTCQTIKPLIKSLIEDEKIGEREGGLGFVEVQMDSTLIEDLPIKYRVRKILPCCVHRTWG
jgi:thiol-disulfide isomerase/thioredoxin